MTDHDRDDITRIEILADVHEMLLDLHKRARRDQRRAERSADEARRRGVDAGTYHALADYHRVAAQVWTEVEAKLIEAGFLSPVPRP